MGTDPSLVVKPLSFDGLSQIVFLPAIDGTGTRSNTGCTRDEVESFEIIEVGAKGELSGEDEARILSFTEDSCSCPLGRVLVCHVGHPDGSFIPASWEFSFGTLSFGQLKASSDAVRDAVYDSESDSESDGEAGAAEAPMFPAISRHPILALRDKYISDSR